MASKQSIRDSFKSAVETTGHARATAELNERRIAEDTSGRYSKQSKRVAALRADILRAGQGSPVEAALLEQALAEYSDTTAEQVAREMGDDGSRSAAPDGRSLQQVARAHGAEVWRRDDGERRFLFGDGSAIVTSGGAWDLRHADCECGWCWAGVELHCDEPHGSEVFLTASTLDAEDAEHAE